MMLRDRMVCGINHDHIQRRLLSEATLTFDTALQLTQAIESADKDAQDLKPFPSEPEVVYFNKSKLPGTSSTDKPTCTP